MITQTEFVDFADQVVRLLHQPHGEVKAMHFRTGFVTFRWQTYIDNKKSTAECTLTEHDFFGATVEQVATHVNNFWQHLYIKKAKKMTTYLYKVQLKDKNEFIRIDIMLINGQWFWSHHNCFTVMLLEGTNFNECNVAQAVAELAGWKLIGEIK